LAGKGLLDRLLALKTVAAVALRSRRVYWQTVAELRALSDRELADLGIARAAIPGIAHEAAYGR
jgi:uncharacterized protein YjiS (DUF1127 family)